jgi:hypothetical protein
LTEDEPNSKSIINMNKKEKYSSNSRGSGELDETFRFDSRAALRVSRTRLDSNAEINLEDSESTSELMRGAEYRNGHILELLSESEEGKRTLKEEREGRKELWDFFARFEKESNPDITISEIEMPPKNRRQKSGSQGRESQPVLQFRAKESNREEREEGKQYT